MPTVIDEFVVSIGLDPAKFTAGQKAVLDQFRKTQQTALDAAKNTETAASSVGDTISKTTGKLLGLLSLFAGGVGLKQFIGEQTRLGAETGRTAQLLDTTTTVLSKWRNLAVLTGGSAQGITSAIGGLVSQFQNFALTGESSVIPYFRALDVQIADSSGRMRKMDDILLDLADRFSKLDPAKARAFGQALGFDEATISLLLQGRDAVAAALKSAEGLGTVTKADAEAASRLQKAWNEVEIAITSAGRAALTKAEPVLTRVLNGFARLAQGKAGNPGSILDRIVNGSNRGGGSNSGAEPSEVWTGGPGAALRAKPGAGETSIGTAALAQSLQAEIPGLDRFTAFNDKYHALLGRSSAHQRGQALDFTLKNPSESAAVAEAVRRKLSALGIDGTVLDEYQNPSKGSTGGHLHVQFNSAAAAQRYADIAQAGRGGAVGGGNRTSSVTVGKIEITTAATDAPGIAATIQPAIERSTLVTQAQAGPQ